MNNGRAVEFGEDEFRNQNKDVPWLCQAIRNGGYATGSLNAPENSIDWLNEMLQVRALSDFILAEQPDLVLTDAIRRLRTETEKSRELLFKDLSADEQDAIKRLNRLTLELAFPRETPKIDYLLTAFIRTRQGSNVLQDYDNVQDFKQDMKERREDVKWGLLVRCDEGKVVDSYFSQLGSREKIGLVSTEPKSASVTPEELSPQQAALREAAIKHFKSNKAKAYISQQMTHVNASRQLGEAISYLFDDAGNPPPLAPLEDIIQEREETEVKIKWLEAICAELHNTLAQIKELEEDALALLSRT